ncbi:MAG: hypothetical protein U0165_12685 [Polyangiaceae bacterium]
MAARLESSLDRLERYTPLAASLGNVLEITKAEARRFLHTIDDPTPWEPGCARFELSIDQPKALRWKDACRILVRLALRGQCRHIHHGEEFRCFVIDGVLIDGGERHHSAVLIAETT